MKALNGVRLLDLSHMLSGPYAAMLLADLGADTIKIEPPGEGEGTRRLLASDPKNSRHGMGAYFLAVNRNKRSVTADLKSEAGRALLHELVKIFDIVLYNFSAGVPDRLGLTHSVLSGINPRIITCSITGFGETGPHRELPSFDMVAQGIGGGMSITGAAGGEPLRAGIPIGDLGGGLMATVGILAALQARHTTGRGQHVDISMQDAQISLLSYLATAHFLSGEVPAANGNDHFVHVPYGTFPTRDGHIIIAVIVDVFWKNLMGIVEIPELDTPENARQPGRDKNREQIRRLLSERLSTDTQEHWLARLREARIPCAPVNNLAQALGDPQVVARNMVVDVPLSQGGSVRMAGNPIKLSHTHDDSFTAPPGVGEHTDSVLRELLGKTGEEIAALRSAGVV
jgi:crotonobetainyl-CoA:carnitine CoA-transferase CaiB-like acyl-CoA transferase